ncbi:MAG: amidohydrolase [Chloroflexota bacterium]|nr:MAG: amidohydrolase [Chloroflexota bacterium]
MLEDAQHIKSELIEWRRAIHRYPELGFNVFRTAELVTQTLNGLGIETQNGVGKSGVVAYLGEQPGPIIAIRADMDALPIQEENEVDYASQIPGSMHACGHDAHTAILLGVAKLLSQKTLRGQVRLLFQPSEEVADEDGVSGAPRMIEDGALENVDAVIALHVDGKLKTGEISIEEGWVGAAADTFRAHIIGYGGHGAYPHQTVDSIWLTSNVLNALYAIPSRQIRPLEPSVVTVGVIEGGTADNVIPDTVYLEGTLRSFSNEIREQLIQEVERVLSITRSLGGDYDLEIERGYPPQHNDDQVSAWIRQVGIDLLGHNKVSGAQRTMGAEDFSFMTQITKGAMFNLGVKLPDSDPRYLHTATFDLDENALPIGSAVLAEIALRFLNGDL